MKIIYNYSFIYNRHNSSASLCHPVSPKRGAIGQLVKIKYVLPPETAMGKLSVLLVHAWV
jgi:hypothetical protein